MSTANWKTCHNDREKYALYLASREWSVLKEAVRLRCNGICERCKCNSIDAVHHLTYIRKYQERLADLQAICQPCHEFIHGKSDSDPAKHDPTRGLYLAVLVGLIDLGTHEDDYHRAVHKALFCWEIPVQPNNPNEPIMVAQSYSFSPTLNANSCLYKMLKNWEGRELFHREKIDISRYLSKPCILKIRRNRDIKGDHYDKIIAIHPLPQDAETPAVSVTPYTWHFGDGPLALPHWVPKLHGESVREMVGRSREAKSAKRSNGQHKSGEQTR